MNICSYIKKDFFINNYINIFECYNYNYNYLYKYIIIV